VVVLRVEGGLFFANAEHVRAMIRAQIRSDTQGVVLDAQTMPFVDVTGARMLGELARELERRGIALVVVRDIGQVKDVLRRTDGGQPLVQVHSRIQEAVDAVLRGEVAPPQRGPSRGV
jgi:anti-anti-sigma factor